MRKNNIIHILLCLIIFVSLSILFIGCKKTEEKDVIENNVETEITFQKSKYNWRLVGHTYTLQNYNENVRAFDPNGKQLEVSNEGKIILDTVGKYTFVYPQKMEELYAVISRPVSTLTLLNNINESYPCGTMLTLPTLSIQNDVYSFDFYYVDITINGNREETLKVFIGETTIYQLLYNGEYSFEYFVVNDRGEKETISISTTAVNQKVIIAEDIKSEVLAGETISFGYPYAFYNGEFYDVKISVKDSNGEKEVKGQTYKVTCAGEYTVKYSTTIQGETIQSEKYFTSILDNSSFVVNQGDGEVLGIKDLPSWNTNTNYNKGLLITGKTSNTKLTYKGVIDLSKLTKNDNLLAFLPYSNVEDDAYMEGLRIVFTDVHDNSRSISLYFWATEGSTGKDNPSTFATVEINGGRYGINNQNNTGKLQERTGTIAYFSSFKGAFTNKSDIFSIQYDYDNEILYLTTERNAVSYPMQQYVFMPLSGSGELPAGTSRLPEDSWFKGFTTGEVYMSVEMITNKNAGVYLCEVAGKLYDELETEYDKSLFVFDGNINSLSNGVVNKEYIIPTVHINDNFGISSKISILVKDINGQIINLVDGKFIPTVKGTYYVTYSIDYYGTIKEKTYSFEIGEIDIDIDIDVDIKSIKFGEYMSKPLVTVGGGNDKIEFDYSIWIGNAKLQSSSNGKYLIDKEGLLKIIVNAYDLSGNKKTEQFEVEILDGYRFLLEDDLSSAINRGGNLYIPNATIKMSTGGIYEEKQASIKILENNVEKTFNNSQYNVSNEANIIEIIYSFDFGGKIETKSYFVNVLPQEITSICDYLLTSDNIIKGINDNGITFKLNGEGSFEMPYMVACENLLISFGLKSNSINVKWEFILVDKNYKENKIKVTLKDLNKKEISINVNNSLETKITGVVCEDYVIFSFVLNSSNNVIMDYYTEKTLLNVTTYENGEIFTGFSNGACLVKSNLSSSTECDLLLCQIGNQYFNQSSNYYTNCDCVSPTIVFNGDTSSKLVSYGYKLITPTANSYDVLSGIYGVTVRIVANGLEVMSQRDASYSYEFTLDEYCTYSVIYEALDNVGNCTYEQFNIAVLDEENPTIDVNGNYLYEYKVGDIVKINSFTAKDNQGNTKTVIFIKNDDIKLTFVKAGMDYEFTEKGNYEIVYLVFDESGNTIRKSFRVTVR